MRGLTMTEEQVRAHQEKHGRARPVVLGSGGEKQRGAAEPKPLKTPRAAWNYESRLAQKLEDAGITGFFVDSEYLPERGLRADILFPAPICLVVEVQGAAHRIRDKWKRDIEKAQATMLAGFRLLPIATEQVRSGEAVEIIRKALAL